METTELTANLHLFRFEVGQAYLWRDDDGLTLIDTGVPGSGALIEHGITELGFHPRELKRVVLTHFHGDHAGSAAEIRASTGAPIIAHRCDAPLIRGELPPPPPVLTDWERPLFERVGKGNLLTGPPAQVDQEVEGGEVPEFGGGARVIAIPGHTDGSIAVHLPEHGVLFTGDTVAEAQGTVMLGVFNLDRELTAESFCRLAEFDTDIACFGHGDPVLGGAGTKLRAVASTLGG